MKSTVVIFIFFFAAYSQMITDEKPVLLEFGLDGQGVKVARKLIVYKDKTMLLIKDTISLHDTLHGSMSDQKLEEVQALFAEDSWITSDTNMIGCLACPVFYIVYDTRTVQGTASPSGELRNLYDVLVELMDSFQPTSSRSYFRHPWRRSKVISAKIITLQNQAHSPCLLVKGTEHVAPFRIDGRQVMSYKVDVDRHR